LFGSFDTQWELMPALDEACRECRDLNACSLNLTKCPMNGILLFHQRIMTSNRALTNALHTIDKLDIDRVASQHGGVISSKEDVKAIIRHLRALKNVGIDCLLSGEYL
jgi:hypothetical protein